jgi:hypothetical protein
MAAPRAKQRISRADCETAVQAFREARRRCVDGSSPFEVSARALGLNPKSLRHRLRRALEYYGIDAELPASAEPEAPPQPDKMQPRHVVHEAWVEGGGLEIISRPDNTFLFGACGDLHAASKYCRWDVREDLIRTYERERVQAIFDTGNWIDGEARFNVHDLEVHGLDQQLRCLASRHPKTSIPIHAVWGDDHEGWYGQREGIDVGSYAEGIMRAAGHDWHNLGFMEAHVHLVNANTGKAATLAVVHPGGGSAYALSYSIQKIIESYEGGEKPHAAFYGHYHKLWSGIIRNVWVVQTGCGQDQTPFMRKKRLEAHVGGALVKLTQDPETGALTRMSPELLRYFNKAWYGQSGRWSHHGPVTMPERVMGSGR